VAPTTVSRGPGGGASSTSASRRACTPKLRTAEANSTGVVRPARKDSWSWSAPVASSSEASSSAASHAAPSRAAACSGVNRSSGAMRAPPAVWVYRTYSPVARSTTPRKSPAMPTGQVRGVGVSPVRSAISSISSRGSRPGRSHLFTTVMIGMPRCLQTANSFMVWGSRPLAASMSMTAASTAASTR